MTPHKVQCFERNGEPYGRYVNPHTWLFETYADSITSECPAEILYENYNFHDFEVFAESNTFPMPGAEIGKTYQRDEVEVMEQYCYIDWHDGNKLICDALRQKGEIPVRQIFRLVISKTETTPQPVEEEPETVERLICNTCCAQGIKGDEVGQPFAPYSDRVICKSCWSEFIEWQKQKSK